jgi:GT2 family glycosyltransferase
VKNNLNIGVLTYGERKHLLVPVLERLLAQSGIDIFVLCNGIEDELYDFYLKTFDLYEQIVFIRSQKNTGSAGGYHELIKYVANVDASKYLLLLDDDNMVPEDFSSKLKNINLGSDINFINRANRKVLVKSRDLRMPCLQIGTKNSFLGRDIFKAIYSSYEITDGDLIAAPYSGLILPPSVLTSSILPNKTYFLYADDHEYTYRLVTQYGYKLILIDDISLIDLEESFHMKKDSFSFLSNRYLHADKLRLYFSVRNQVHFGLKRSESKFVFTVNGLAVSAYILLGFLLRGQFRKIAWYFDAVISGCYFKDI